MADVNNSSLGGADAEKLHHIAHAGTLPDADDDSLPWDASWIDTFDLWSRADPAHGVIFLLFSPTPGVLGRDYKAPRLPLFAQQAQPPTAGVYVVGRAATTHAWRLPIDIDFEAACNAIALDPALKDLPTVVLGRRHRRMFYFRSGLGFDGDYAVELALDRSERELNWPRLESQLMRFEDECLNTLEMIHKVWKEPTKWHPIEGAEGVIQSYLEVALRMVFRGFTTASEVNMPVGRVDLLLLPRDPAAATRALVELKVLRTYSCTGATEYKKPAWQEILNEGRRQALSYAQTAGAAIKVLCAYDMRKEKTTDVLQDAEEECTREGVTLRTCLVHNSVQAVRKA